LVRLPDLLHLPDWSHWYGYGIGVEEQGAHIVIFCRTAELPFALAGLIENIGSQQYRLRVNGRTFEVRIIVTGRFVTIGGGGPVAAVSNRICAGGPVRATWKQGPFNKSSPIGTIGAILRKAGDPKPWLLSANHVIGINCRAINQDFKVLLPNPAGPDETIGTVVDCVKMSSAPCPADAAAVPIDLPTSRIDTTHPSGLTSRTPFPLNGTSPVILKKGGGTTSAREAKLIAVNTTMDIDVEFRGNVEMNDQIVTAKLADHGDSGVLTVEKSSGQPVGLAIALASPTTPGGSELNVISPIQAVLDNLDPAFSLVLPGEVL
jgi:hypothetical protein